MAFVTQRGKRFQVRHGRTGRVLSSYGSRSKAQSEMNRLHRKNKPKPSSRGAAARRRYRARK